MSGRTRPLSTVPGLLELAERQLGIVGRTQLRTLGVSRDHEQNQIRAQRWSRPTRRVVALMTGVLDRDQWMWIGLLHGGEPSRLVAATALEGHGLVGWEPDLVHVEVPHGRRVPAAAGLGVHHSRRFGDAEHVVRRGLRLEPAGRAVVSATQGFASERRALGLVLAAVQQRIVLPGEVSAQLVPGLKHGAAIRRVLGEAASGADSLREVDVTRLLRRAGITSYRRQVRIPTQAGARPYDIGVDLPDGSLLLVEVDGVHHLDPRRRELDAEKDAAALALGHLVMRIPVQVVGEQEDRLVQQLTRIRLGAEARASRRW